MSFRIEDMRPIVSDAQQAPSQGRWRVMLMEDADRMVERTSNVLLKAIESGKINFWVLPDDGGVNLTAPTDAATAPPTDG